MTQKTCRKQLEGQAEKGGVDICLAVVVGSYATVVTNHGVDVDSMDATMTRCTLSDEDIDKGEYSRSSESG